MFRFHIVHHLDESAIKLLEGIHRRLNQMEHDIMSLTPQVQALVDAVEANKNGVKAALDGLAAEAVQIADLQAQLAAIVPGEPIDAEDLAAITAAAATLSETNTALTAAVPANVEPAAEPQPPAEVPSAGTS